MLDHLPLNGRSRGGLGEMGGPSLVHVSAHEHDSDEHARDREDAVEGELRERSRVYKGQVSLELEFRWEEREAGRY